MKERLKLNQQGLTLVELIIGLALASVIMAAIATFLVGNISFSNTAQEEIYIQGQVRNAMKVITDLAMDKGKYEKDYRQYIISMNELEEEIKTLMN